ncbi:winged helix-turn-helix domain-containing protein [Dyadobacter sp. CY326]|uniref:winged helix-turn-helix domain-containing protein n=1 Tax=Dyadobacter sp. CY326 TaxID=2907300 RepID=UPI001F1AFBF4|nr:winged helix-turn-helix domain-containing protein [Dyadobacter sp. CY326]MCE7067172.1 winged helix-turn-helix domain-containing protein [Dyadobacter sp. CY326]
MRVNPAFTGFFTNRLLVRACIAMMLLAIFVSPSSFAEHSERNLRVKQVNLSIRQTGHRLLLQAGDSTSRVLPVTEISEGTFLLRFENEFIFNHDSLIALSQSLLPKKQFPSGYTVTVHECVKGSIVYGFQVNNSSPDILACTGRSQPSGCYTIEFAFPDFYENVKRKKEDTDQLTESLKADTQEKNPKVGELKTPTSDYHTGQRTKDPKSVKANTQEVNPTLGESETTTVHYPLIKVVYAGILALLVVTLLIGRFGNFFKPLAGQNQNDAIMQESVPELAALGKFLFNVKGQRLLLESEVVSLTDKECKVLNLLHQNFGELIPRETLMQEVWINEGVITGRSLDMFVSKLRKKLSRDPELRITNVHGKGYKLEIPERQII